MKVDTDGMVAIIQGLQDSGLAVTLVGHRGNIAKANAIPITHAKSSVETRVTPKAVMDAAAQLCDDRYTSSYQVAHCNARPTSPCPNSPEFPRQRSDFNNLNTTQGNFEVGGPGNENTRAPIKISIHHRNEYNIRERGLLSNSQSSKGTLAFVSSLRKYPSITPEKKFSSEFVQRIIAYTQAKNISKSSHHSKLMRKLRNEDIKERSTDTVGSGKVCKGIQTHERIQPQRKEMDEENETSNAKRRRYRSASPADSRDVRYKSEQIRETYDYLSPRHYRARFTDVHYLSEVTRALKDTLRQICDDQPQSTDSNNSEAQVSVPMVSRGVSCLPSCNAIPGTYIPICPPRPQLCCFCQKPLPCSCLERSEDEIFEKHLEEAVCSWLEEIPVCSNDKPQNQTLREIMVMDLIDKLKSLYRDEHFDENARNEITQCVNNLPMWCPGNKHNQEVFRTQIVDNLMNKIRGLSKDFQKYKKEIAKWLNDISFYCKDFQGRIINVNAVKEKLVDKIFALAINPPSDENLKPDIVAVLNEFPIKAERDKDIYIDNLAEMLVDKIQSLSSESTNMKVLTEQILEWLKDIPELSGNKLGNQKTAEQLANMIQEFVKDNKNESDLENKISDWLSETLKSKGKSLDTRNQNNLVKRLLGKMNAVSGMKDEAFKNEILNILENIPDLDTTSNKIKNMAGQFAKKIRALQTNGKENVSEDILKDEINDWLSNLSKNTGIQITPEDKEKLANKLLSATNNVSKQRKRWSKQGDLKKIINDQISQIFENNAVELDEDTKKNLQNKISDSVAKNLENTQSTGGDDIKMELVDILENEGGVDPQKANQIADEIITITKTIEILRQRRILQELDFMNSLRGEVNNILDGMDIENKDEVELEISNILADQALRGTSYEETRKRLTDVLKNVNLSDEEAENFTYELMGMQKDLADYHLTPDIPQSSKSLSPTQKQIFIDNAQNEILDFTENLTGDSSGYSTKKNKVAAEELAKRVIDTISESTTTPADKEEQLNDEVLQYFDDVDIPRPKQKEQAKKLVDRLQKIPFTKSTPRSSNTETERRFRRGESQGPISPITSDSTYNQYQRPLAQKEKPYMSQLTKSSTITGDSTNKKEKSYMSQPADEALRGTSDEEIRGRLIDVLKSLKFSDEEASKLTFELMGMQKDMPDHHTPNISQTSKSLSPTQKQIFIDNAQNEILDFTENLTGDSSVYSTKKNKVAAEKLAKRVIDTISESTTTPADKEEQLNDEVLQYFDDLEIPRPKQKKQAKKLIDMLQKIPFTTSTPRNLNTETERHFRRGESQGPISPITSDSTYNQYQRPLAQKEKPYMSQPTKSSTITGDSTNKKEKSYVSQPADEALRGTSDEEIRGRLIDVLKSLKFSDEESRKLASELMGMQKDMSDHLTPNISQTSKSLSPMQKQIFIENAQKEILDFTENLTGNSSVYSTKKNKVAAEKLAKRVSDKISESNTTPADKEEQLNYEVLQYFDEVEIPRPKQKEQAKKLVDRLQKIPFTTSTPRSSNTETERRFRRGESQGSISPITGDRTNKKEKSYMSQPTKSSTTVSGDSDNDYQQPSSKKEKPYKSQLSTKKSTKTGNSTNKKHKPYMSQPTKSSTIITGDSDSTYNRYQQPPSNKEKQYMAQLTTIIDSWLDKLPIHFDKEDGKVFKEAMIRDLVSDIVDRQKYLQLNPNAKTSDEEELEHLKYQMFRYLNKLPDAKELLPSIAKTPELMNLLKGVSVPQLTKDKGVTLDPQNTSDLSSIQDEISSWFGAIPARLFKSKNKNHHEKMIQELADNIDEYQKNNTLSETILDQLIFEWLQKVLTDSKQSLKNKSETLKALLVNKGLVTSLDLLLNDSQFTDIDEWIQSLPLKSRPTSGDLKQMERIKQDFIENLKQIQKQYPPGTPNYKAKMKEAIKKYLQLFPIELNKRNDQAFLQQKVEELFAKLNASPAEYQSKRPSINNTELQNIVTNPADIFYNDIENWVDNLPIFPGDTPEENERVKTLKQNIISKLLNKIGELNMKPDIFQDDILYEDLLKDEIDDLLSILPQTPDSINNMESVKENLIEKVLQAKQKAQNEMEGHTYKQQLRDAISTTLPSVDKITEEERVSFEVLKDAVADAYINLNYSLDNESKNKYKQKIADEISKFCNDYLKRYPASPVDPKKLNQELYTALQKVPRPKDDTIKSQVEQVRIKDQIHEWLNDILLDNLSPDQKLQKNKIVSVLANALHETEKEKRSNPNIDAEDKFRQDIIKWAKKLPLNSEAKANTDEEADKLIERLKSTEDTRRFNISTLKRTSQLSQYQIPPSTLTENDRAHLQRIRQRTQRSPCRLPLPICLCKDASVNPMAVDAGSQTEMNVQQPLSPNININEYNWGSTADSRVWETQNGSDSQPGLPYPSMHGTRYPSMSQQQMSSPFLPLGNQSMALSPQGSLNAIPKNQYESLQPVPCVAIEPPCSKPPPCMPQATQPCVTLNPPCAETQPPCISFPPNVATQPPCPPDDSSYSPCLSPSPCKRPLPCERQPPCSQSPLAVSTQPCQSKQPPCTISSPCIAPPPCMPPSPCIRPPPCMPQRLSVTVPQNGNCPLPPPSCLSQGASPGVSQRRKSKKPRFQVKSSDFSNTSSPAEEYAQGQSFECQPRVTRLGSFDDNPPCRRTCGFQSPEAITSCRSPYDECKWVQENDDGNLGVPCQKRRPFKLSLQSKDFICDREAARPKCHCRSRSLRKSLSRRFCGNQTPCLTTDSMKHCSKCCGIHCPHPSYLFFKY